MLLHLAHPSQRLELLGLLLLWAAFLFGGFLFGKPDAGRTRRMPTWTRLASSCTLVLAAWSCSFFTQDTSLATFSLLIAIGMTFGCLGDFLLAELFPLPQPVLGGMAAFGLGHLAYIAALVLVGNQLHLTAPAARFGSWAAWVLIGLLGWYFLVLRGHIPTLLHWAALPYALLLASTAGFATGLALQDATFLPLALGAALFPARRSDPGRAALQPPTFPAHRRCHLVDVWSGANVDCLYVGQGLTSWVNLKVRGSHRGGKATRSRVSGKDEIE